MKVFQDLEFKKHRLAIEAEKFPPSCKDLAKRYNGAKHAVIVFDNGWGLSVILGKCFYSNGVDTYECAISKMVEWMEMYYRIKQKNRYNL